MMGTAKTPVSILNEYMFRAKEVPEFRLIQSVTGPDPAFEYEVTVDKIKAKGCGRSKKEAKHNAAHNALVELAKSDDLIRKQLLTCCGISATQAADRNDNDIAQVAASPYAEQIKINAVGELSTLCALNDLPTPEYKVVEESGPAHCKTFKMHCIIHNLIGVGEARTKQQAKHISAQRMMDKLKEHIEKPATGIEYDIMKKSDANSKDHTVAKRNYCVLKEKERGTTIKENLKLNLATCHLNLRGLVGTEVQALKEKKTPYVDPEVILNRFAEEQQVKYSYEIINSQKGQDNSEEYLCAAMLSTVPELVQFGFASSPELARDVAANSLFKCLITMLED